MNSVAIITARGGSKRIPRKNIRDFCGRPIIAYSIEAALASNLFDEVMVSTDDEEIATVARKWGASVPFMRSKGASNDRATTADVISEVIEEYRHRGRNFDIFCCIYPTAPFLDKGELCAAWRMMEEGAASVLPVTSFDFPPQRGLNVLPDGTVQYAYPEFSETRSQDLISMVHDCGRFYMAKTDSYLAAGTMLMDGCKPLFIDPVAVQDIDTPEDWMLAEAKYRFLEERRNCDEAS